MGNFDDLAMAVASFGGNNKVIFDDLGKPSIMVGIPKMKYSDLITGGTQDILDVFKVDGVERKMLYFSKFINVVVNGRAYSLPMKDPKVNISFETAFAACRTKGAGWGMTPAGLWGAVMLWCNRNKFLPRGNTNWDKSHEKEHERGANTYRDYISHMPDKGGGRTKTGSGPVTWHHNGNPTGIADLCGNVWEWVAGLRTVNCEIQIIPYGNCMKADCDVSAESTEWKAIKPDGSFVTPGTAGTLHYDLVNGKIVIGTSTNSAFSKSIPFSKLEAAPGVNIPQIVRALGLIKDSADIYQEEGHTCYISSDAERMPCRGSTFRCNSSGGIGALYLYKRRNEIGQNDIGFRAAFDEELAKEVKAGNGSSTYD